MGATMSVLLATCAVSLIAVKEDTGPLTVCEVLQNIQKYRGKVISVRGLLHGDYHSGALYASQCGFQLTTGALHWPSALHLQTADYYVGEDAQVVIPFRPEREKMETIGFAHPAWPISRI